MNEKAMIGVVPRQLWLDQDRKIIAFRKNDCLYIFNFHPTESYDNLEPSMKMAGSRSAVPEKQLSMQLIKQIIIYLQNRP
ncbi:alpha amylase C-terminal domain-containing protein [Acetobacterium sp.]|uniref:alpha amylase C-terminal domain-containing protein n=1 Tax=Acetobacterium sp. TaxID=1872094 RepID=UPI002F42FB96